MARPLRIEYPGGVYHIMSRGNAKGRIFLDNRDKEVFLKLLKEVVQRCNWELHSYCLMDNHYHLLVGTPDGNLAEGMKHLNAVYTQRFNKRHNLVGHLFQGRYKSILVQKESYLLALCRYIVLNPVRAGLSKAPWKWSSYPALAGKEECQGGLYREWILSQFGLEEREAERRYEEYVREGVALGEEAFPIKGAVLGDNEYRQQIERQLQDMPAGRELPVGQQMMSRPFLNDVLRHKDRRERNRQIYEAWHSYRYTQKEIAAYLGVHYSLISRIVAAEKSKSVTFKA